MDWEEPRARRILLPVLIALLLFGAAAGIVAASLMLRDWEPDITELRVSRGMPTSIPATAVALGRDEPTSVPVATLPVLLLPTITAPPPRATAQSAPMVAAAIATANAPTTVASTPVVPLPTSTSQPSPTNVPATQTPRPMVTVAPPTVTLPPSPTVPSPTVAARALSPTVEPTATGQPTITPTPPSPVLLRERIATAEAALRSGQIEAEIVQGDGTRWSAVIRFTSSASQQSRLHITLTQHGESGDQTQEHIAIGDPWIGDRWWQRQPDGSWVPTPSRGGVWEQIQPFLPHANAAPAMAIREVAETTTTVQWRDAARDADITLVVATESGIPRELRQVTPAAPGATVTITYALWNSPVEINEPYSP